MYGQTTTLDCILKAMAAQVVAGAGVPAQSVIITLAEDRDHCETPPGDRFVTIRPVSFPVGLGVGGGGRATTGFDSTIHMGVVVRLGSDQELRQARLLNDKTMGVIVLLNKLLNAMQLFQPTDNSGNVIVREPMRLESVSFDPMIRNGGMAWCAVRTQWNVFWNQELSQ